MYASIRGYRVKRNRLKELDRIVSEEFVPLVSKLPGFVAYFGIDQGDGKWASISIFSSEEAAKASNKTAAEFVQKRVMPLIESGPELTTGIVAAIGPSAHGEAAFEEPAQPH